MRELVQYICQYQPGFDGTVRGASREEIDEFQGLAKRPLTADHRDYLATMGRSAGSFKMRQGDINLGVSALLNFYRGSNAEPPPKSTLAGVDISGEMNLYLQDVEGQPEPIVVQAGGGESYIDCPNFANLLFASAVAQYRLKALRYQATLQEGETARPGRGGALYRLKTLQNVTEDFGLTPVPKTGTWVPCYENATAAIRAHEPPGGGATYSLSADGEAEFNNILAWLVQMLRLIRVK
jgi:hypothetical protein